MMMNEPIELLGLVAQPANRRCWLLFKALESVPLDQAVDWARTAEDFIAGTNLSSRVEEVTVSPDATPQERKQAPPSVDQPMVSPPPIVRADTQKRARLDLTPDRREQLIRRLAQGARNAELATEFGLSSQQVQGVRMGAARKNIRRDQLIPTQPSSDQTPTLGVSVEEVVRYLRQQNDVVVSAENGEFLVNARFRLALADLVARANRMRVRQGKPEFPLNAHPSIPSKKAAPVNGHPMFWSRNAAPPISTDLIDPNS
jgi:hypothetical protein